MKEQKQTITELEEDREFYKKQLMEEKKKNKLLKLAISRLQLEIEGNPEDLKKDSKVVKGDTFITDLLNDTTAVSINNLQISKELQDNNPSLFVDESTINASFLQENSLTKPLQNRSLHRRYQST